MARPALVWIAAALSGAAALAYEIGWSRALVVPLGNSADAAALVLAGFMLGIAAGARLAGGVAERTRAPLRLYAALELALALYALCAPRLLALLVGIPGTGAAGVLARAAAAFVLVATPGLAMGASLPLLVRAVVAPGASLRLRVGVTYAANTLGAAAGAFATGFWAIAELGIAKSSMLAGGLGGAAAAVALVAWRASAEPAPAAFAPAETVTEFTDGNKRYRRGALVATSVAGFCMLGAELLWARVLTFVFGHDTYAFASLLAWVLVGLGVGGLLHRVLARVDPAKLTAALLGCLAVSMLVSFWAAAALVVARGRDPFLFEASGRFGNSLALEAYRELAYTPLLVLAPSIFAGALFPAACSLHAGSSGAAGQSVGTVGLWNGIGSALGALAGAYGLGAVVGIQPAFVMLAVLAAVAAGVVLARSPARAFLPLAAVAAVVLFLPPALPRHMLLAAVGPRHQHLLHYDEARTGTISVIENDLNGERQLLVNAVNEVTTRLVHDQSFALLGHLGPLFHPSPKSVVMICLGAGLAAGAATRHPIDRLDVVDLAPAVAGGARLFTAENHGVLDDPRFHFHVGDGRHYLLDAGERWDVAIIDSTHPKSVDSWILYTRELYELVRDRLADGGIVVQWLPLHGLSEREIGIVVRTFQSAFPDMTLWANVGFETYGQVGYTKLVGVKGGPLVIDYRRLAARLAEPAVAADLARFGMDSPAEILDLFVAGPDKLARWTEGLPIQTDDHPLVPYTTSWSRGRRMTPPLLLAIREPVGPFVRGMTGEEAAEVDRAALAQGLVIAGDLETARELRPNGKKLALFAAQRETTRPYYDALAARYDDDADRNYEAATQLAALGWMERSLPFYERALRLRPDDFRVALELALARADQSQWQKALDDLAHLRARRPGVALVHQNLGAVVLANGDPGTAIPHFEAAVALDPHAPGAWLGLAEAHLATGELDRAENALEHVLTESPWHAGAHRLLGLAAATRGDHAAAVSHYRTAAELSPYDRDLLRDLGAVLQASGALDEAIATYERALVLHPRDYRTLDALGTALTAAGRFEEAADCHLRVLEIDPEGAEAAYHLGQALRGQKRSHEAAGAYCLALRLAPNLAAAQRELTAMGTTCDEK